MIVSNTSDLIKALNAAQGGEKIELAPGEYGAVSMRAPRAYASEVLVTAADPANRPVFTAANAFRDFVNLSLTQLEFMLPENRITYMPMVRLYGGKSISITSCGFTGEKTTADYYGYGIQAQDTVGLFINGNRFSALHRGALVYNITDFSIDDNEASDIRVDAFIMANMHKGTVNRNLIHGFHTGSEHPDAIQVHANNALGSSDIEIADNLIISDADNRIQGIFITGSEPGQPVQRHARFSIRNNKLAATMWNAIAPFAVDDLVCENNEVLSIAAPDNMVSWIRYDAPHTYDQPVGVSNGNRASKYLPTAGVKQDDTTTPYATQAEIDAMRAAWLTKFRAPPPVDPLVLLSELVEQHAQMGATIAELQGRLTQ